MNVLWYHYLLLKLGLEEALMCDVSPNGGSPNSKGLEFEFKGNSDHYMDPSEMYLYFKLK